MNVIILGATSFLGKYIVRLLIERGDNIVAIGRKKESIFPKEVKYLSLEMSQYKLLPMHVGYADVIINLAWAGTGHGERDNEEIQKRNIEYSLDALRAAKKLGCKVFIEAGSQAEYGLTKRITKENSKCNPVSEYGKAKLELQNKAFDLSKELGISYVHLRIYSLIGVGDHDWTLVMSAIDAMMHDKPMNLTECTQLWNFLSVEDAAKMIVEICSHFFDLSIPRQSVINIASDDTRPLKDFVEEIKFITESKSICNYGAVECKNPVSLNPSIDTYLSEIGVMEFTPFKLIIKKIIESKI